MILDKQNMMSYKQAITVTANSTNVIDLGPPFQKASGDDDAIPLALYVDTPFTDAGSDATLNVALQSSPVENFGSGVIEHWNHTFVFGDMTNVGKPGGLSHMPAIPPDVQRYVRGVYTVASGPFTAGNLTFGVTASRQTNR